MRLNKFWEDNHRTNHLGWLSGYDINHYRLYHSSMAELNSDSVVLEIGIGTGTATKQISDSCKELYTVDIVAEALEKVKDFSKTYLTKDFSNVPSDIMDLVICNLVLQHCNDEEAKLLVEQGVRVLKPGGKFSLQTANSTGLRGSGKSYEDSGYLIMRDKSVVIDWIESFGGFVVGDSQFEHRGEHITWNVLAITKEKTND